ncbi:MAG: phosphoribosylanthranilate isomerase [Pseudomonadota bacterium]
MQTKLCGFTTKETVDLAVASGADFIGFVFYPKSARNISAKRAAEIAHDIPRSVRVVAVIVDAQDKKIREILKYLQPDLLQIHSSKKSRILEIKNQFQIPIIKAFPISETKDLELVQDYENIADMFLFDGKTSGSGESFDWKILQNLKTKKRWFLSGGLNIDNIDEALKITGARMIDLSSGIEEARGIKSPKLITEFMKKIHSLSTSKK